MSGVCRQADRRTDGQSSGEIIIDLRRIIGVALSVREFLY